jgi:hypothetical protein
MVVSYHWEEAPPMQVRDRGPHPQRRDGPAWRLATPGALVLGACVALAGCAAGGGLAKPGGTAKELQRDHAACVSWMYGISVPRDRGPVRWTYYDWCMREKGYRKEGVVANGGFEPPTKGL